MVTGIPPVCVTVGCLYQLVRVRARVRVSVLCSYISRGVHTFRFRVEIHRLISRC